MKRFYLDYNATTPLDSEVLDAMLPYWREKFGNPSSIHAWGREARSAMDNARSQMAEILGTRSKEIIFTSGGTESNNLAIRGLVEAWAAGKGHILTCQTEHHAVLHPCQKLEREGFVVTYLPVLPSGELDLDLFEKSFRADTILVSIMSANNETGVLHPVAKIGKICREKGVPFHCDAIQSFGKQRVHVEEWNVDLLSLAAHKFYGPKGVGLLYVRSGTPLKPLLLGGSHENDRRAGTENVACVVGMAMAAKKYGVHVEAEDRRLHEITEEFWELLRQRIPGIHRNGSRESRLGNTLNVSFENCAGESLLVGLDLQGIGVSTGSACMVGSVQPSHVLEAMGVDRRLLRSTLRFSFGKDSQREDLAEIANRIQGFVERLRNQPTVESFVR